MPTTAARAIAAAMSSLDGLAERIVMRMRELGMPVDEAPGHMLPVYVEGANADLTANSDSIDRWNDMGGILSFVDGKPRLFCWHVCTTEPGYAATYSNGAKALGGVARMPLGYHADKWVMGFHKGHTDHPALRQAGPLYVHRDTNRDGKRTGDALKRATGINHHSTRPGYNGHNVGMFSAGCFVRRNWEDHMEFIWLLKQDARYQADKWFSFSCALLDGSKIL